MVYNKWVSKKKCYAINSTTINKFKYVCNSKYYTKKTYDNRFNYGIKTLNHLPHGKSNHGKNKGYCIKSMTTIRKK